MFLLALPSEILILIFNYLGSAYFRKGPGQLTICKDWYRFAQVVLYRHLELTPAILRQVCSSEHADKSLLLIQESTESLDITMKGYTKWMTVRVPQGHPRDAFSFWRRGAGRALLTEWTSTLNKDLARLAVVAQKSRKLRWMRVDAQVERHSLHRNFAHRNYLSVRVVQSLLSLDNLQVLELDLGGTGLSRLPKKKDGDGDNELHACKAVGALLLTLCRLRLRMGSICADALRPPSPPFPASSGQTDCRGDLRLSEVLVHLGLYHGSSDSTTLASASYCSRCAFAGEDGASGGGGFPELMAEMESQAGALAARMAKPKVVRVLAHTLPYAQVYASDILSGRRIRPNDSSVWDDDGYSVSDGSSVDIEDTSDDVACVL